MNYNFKKITSFLVKSTLVLGLSSLMTCLDPIDLKIPRGFDNTIVVQGILVKGSPSVFELSVSRLFDFTGEGADLVNVRDVTLTDEAGNSVEIERTGTGFYRTTFADNNPDIQIEVGKSYKISFNTFDARSFESFFEPLVASPKIDSLSFETISKQYVFTDGITTVQDSAVSFKVNTPLRHPDSIRNSSVLWDMSRVFQLTDLREKTCYLKETVNLSGIQVFDGFNSPLERLDSYTIHDHRFSHHFAEGMYFEVIQSGLSQGAFAYWDQTSKVLERDGNMFEAPAGRVNTNFYNINDENEIVVGYFYATTQDTARIYVAPEVAGNQNSICDQPPSFGPNEPPPVCIDCLVGPNSTTTKPAFWTQ